MIKDAWADIRYQIFNIIDTEAIPFDTAYLTSWSFLEQEMAQI